MRNSVWYFVLKNKILHKENDEIYQPAIFTFF